MKERIIISSFARNLPVYVDQSISVFNHQPSGMEARTRDLNLFLNFMKEARRKVVNGAALLDFITYLKEVRNNQAGSINRKISSLRSYLKHLRFLGVEGAQELPIEDLRRARNPYPQQVEVPTLEEVKHFFAAIDRDSILGARDFTIYTLLYRLGLRSGEVVNLDISHIDFKTKQITVEGKGRRRRCLPLLDEVADTLATWLAVRVRLKNADTEKALFISRKGHRISPRTLQENFKKHVEASGTYSVDRFVPHTLRHAFASHALETSDDLVTLKHTMGHSHLASTEIYLHPSMRLLKKSLQDHPAAEMLAEMLLNQQIAMPTCQRVSGSPGG